MFQLINGEEPVELTPPPPHRHRNYFYIKNESKYTPKLEHIVPFFQIFFRENISAP